MLALAADAGRQRRERRGLAILSRTLGMGYVTPKLPDILSVSPAASAVVIHGVFAVGKVCRLGWATTNSCAFRMLHPRPPRLKIDDRSFSWIPLLALSRRLNSSEEKRKLGASGM